MIDLSRIKYDDMSDRTVAAGQTVANEGALLIATIENGVEVVGLSTTGSVQVAGFAYNNSLIPGTKVESETKVAPATGTLAIQVLPNVIAGTIRVYNENDAVAYTLGDPSTTATAYSINTTTGLITVGASGAGKTFLITYRRNLTVAEQQTLYGDARFNLGASGVLNAVAMIHGSGLVYTDQYDSSADWSSATQAYAGANGLLAPTGTTVVGRIVSRPSAADKFIGIAFNIA